MRTTNGLGIRLQVQENADRVAALADLPENEVLGLLHRLEELARIEGLREEHTVLKIPTVTQQEIDNKAEDDEVLKHDGTVALSAAWAPGQVITFPNTGLHLLDTDASHDLIIKPGSNLTMDRTLTVTTGDSDRTLTIDENGTLTNYLLKDGSRALTADWDIGDGRKIQADEIAARDEAGLKLYDDGGNGIFVEDGGNIGIGNANPGAILDIAASPGSDDIILDSTGAGTKDPRIQLKVGGTSHLQLYVVSSNTYLNYDANNDGTGEFQILSGGAAAVTVDNAGKMGIGSAPTALLDIDSNILRLRTSKTPASAGASGNQGDICWDGSFLYICIATNTWQRVGHATW